MMSQDETDVRFLSPQDLAERWSISTRTLERWRAVGTGPAWHRLGGKVLYLMGDVLAYEARVRRGDSYERS
jgi:hypothetical protein